MLIQQMRTGQNPSGTRMPNNSTFKIYAALCLVDRSLQRVGHPLQRTQPHHIRATAQKVDGMCMPAAHHSKPPRLSCWQTAGKRQRQGYIGSQFEPHAPTGTASFAYYC